MGTNNIPAAVDANVIPASDHNSLRNSLIDNLVPRNASGNAADIAGDLGTSTFRWKDGYIQKIILGLASNLLTLEESSGNLYVSLNSAVKLRVATSSMNMLDATILSETGVNNLLNNTSTGGVWKLLIDSAERLTVSDTVLNLFNSYTITKAGNDILCDNPDSLGNITWKINSGTILVLKTTGIDIYASGALVGAFDSTGMDGSYLASSTVDTLQLTNSGVTEDKIANDNVTDSKIKKTIATTTVSANPFAGTSTTDDFIDDVSGNPIFASFTPTDATRQIIIQGFSAGGAGATAGLVSCDDGFEISCFRNGVQIGRQGLSFGLHAASSISFYDNGVSTAGTYTFKYKIGTSGTFNATTLLFKIWEI